MQWSFVTKSVKSALKSARARSSYLHSASKRNSSTLFNSSIRKERWIDSLRQVHGGDLVAFCAGSAPLNGCAGGTAAFAVYFPLENDLFFTKPVTDRPTNNRADCLSAKAAVDIANKLDPSGSKRLVINTRYQGLVFSMAGRAGEARWVDRWQNNGWLNSKRELVTNHDVLKTLVAAEKHRSQISWNFVNECKSPDWMVALHHETHEEAERIARRSE